MNNEYHSTIFDFLFLEASADFKFEVGFHNVITLELMGGNSFSPQKKNLQYVRHETQTTCQAHCTNNNLLQRSQLQSSGNQVPETF